MVLGMSYIDRSIKHISRTQQEVTPVGSSTVVLNDMTADEAGQIRRACAITRRIDKTPKTETPPKQQEELTIDAYRNCCVRVA